MREPLPLVLATRSEGKLRELRELFAEVGIRVTDPRELGFRESPIEAKLERFLTFEENARAKASWFSRELGGRAVIAEDSGLEVMALDGGPGVRSKRWAARPGLSGQALDDANNAALVTALDGIEDRRARYVCVALYVDGALEARARGECAGRILESPRGRGGFGYDPYFESVELGRTFAEASLEEKSRVSHRGRAVRGLIAQLRASRVELGLGG